MAQTRRDFLKRTAALSAASFVGIQLPFTAADLARAADGEQWHRGTCRLCGVGGRLVNAALDDVERRGLTVQADCWFVAKAVAKRASD